MHLCCRATLAALLFALPATSAFTQGERIQPTDLFQIRVLGEVAVSPDGRQVVYVVREIVPDPDRDGRHANRAHLWIAPTDGSSPPRQLTRHDAGGTSPAWHPAGRQIAFVRSVDRSPQVFLLPLDGGEAFQVTDLAHGAVSPAFSPDGTTLLVASSIPFDQIDSADGPPWESERPRRSHHDAQAWTADPDGDGDAIRAFLDQQPDEVAVLINRLDFQGEHALNPRPSFRHLFAVDLTGATAGRIPEARPLTRGYVAHSGGAWSPDGRVVFASVPVDTTLHPDRVIGQRLVSIPLAGGPVEAILEIEGMSVGTPLPHPDGRRVAFLAQDLAHLGFLESRIGLLDRQTGEVSWLAADLDRSAGDLVFSQDGEALHFVAATDGGFPLYSIDLGSGDLTRHGDLQYGVRSYDVTDRGIVFVRTTVDNPYELFEAGSDLSYLLPISSHNSEWLQHRQISRPVHHTLTRIEGPDTSVVHYWVMPPVGAAPGERYPLLLQIHGGPSAMWGPGEATMWHEFQMFAARGIGIVFGNPRGSGGYGFDFRRANFADWGYGPAADVLATVDAAVADYDWVDPDRLLITGGSYAGYLTAWIIAHDHRFRAAVAQRGVYDLTTFLGEGNAWRLVPHHFGGYPWESEIGELLDENSPLTHVANIRTPLLIKHGSQDLRTGVIQSEMLYRSLKILGRPVEYVRHPGAGHDLSRTGDPDQRLDRLLRIYEFLERHLN